ncbi:RNA-guided endonuclease TnpB family protein [Clostridium sp.]|uniref:RNA-guided endonuclease TnpB family protein n=1 Tax=Clostridium sp. TaxID=1506 RepID=UPI003D6CB61D
MAKQTTPNYVLTLSLDINNSDEIILDKRFEICRKLYNAILGLGLKKFNALSELKVYKKLRKELAEINKLYFKDKESKKLKIYIELRKQKYKELTNLLGEYGINEYLFINKMTPMYKSFNKNIDNKTAQALASRAWKALEKLIFKDAQKVNFIRYDELKSVEGKWNKSGITYRDGIIKWNGLKIPVIIKSNDIYAQKAIQDRIKYCRIVRKYIRGKYKYYVQLVMEGIPPVKYNKETCDIKRSVGFGNVGIDIGTQTIAISSRYDVKLLELCPEINNIQGIKTKLSRKLDRQRRVNNPNNYNDDGTIKFGIMINKKKERLTWVKSNKYIKTQMELRDIQRKQTDIRKQSHEKLANHIISLGDRILVETMNYKGLQKRSKKNTINARTGKFNKKKRFGKSLGNKAPSKLIDIINRKLKYDELEILKINTHKVKASMYNHFTDEYIKKELKDRWDISTGIQRDCYSAFLIMNVSNDLESINRNLCFESYDNFKQLHDREINRLRTSKENGNKLIASMGI